MTKTPQIETIRAFLSINLPNEMLDSIRQFQEKVGPEVHGIRWTRPENCHFTLKFLGETPVDVLPRIEKSLTPLLNELSPFSLELYGVGQFPPRGAPSVIWIGVNKGSSAVAILEQRIREALVENDIHFDKKKFKPHLTIGRAMRKQRASVRALRDYSEHSFGTFEVESFHLMQSTLGQEGSVYTERIHFPLAQG